MAKTVGVRQLKNEATRIVREVREERAEYLITVDGKPAARLVPVDPSGETPDERDARIQAYMRELDALAKEIGKVWKPGLTAAEAVAEQRR